MKNTINWKPITILTTITAVGIWAFTIPFESRGAGSLTPPKGTPTPTMATQNEISGQLVDISKSVNGVGSSGMNFGLRTLDTVTLWNSTTGLWDNRSLIGVTSLIESDGNFLATSGSSALAWNCKTGQWESVSISGLLRSAKSDGNFCVAGSSQVAAWNKETGDWTTHAISNALTIRRSNGNFCVISTKRAVAWNQNDSEWRVRNISNILQAVSSEN